MIEMKYIAVVGLLLVWCFVLPQVASADIVGQTIGPHEVSFNLTNASLMLNTSFGYWSDKDQMGVIYVVDKSRPSYGVAWITIYSGSSGIIYRDSDVTVQTLKDSGYTNVTVHPMTIDGDPNGWLATGESKYPDYIAEYTPKENVPINILTKPFGMPIDQVRGNGLVDINSKMSLRSTSDLLNTIHVERVAYVPAPANAPHGKEMETIGPYNVSFDLGQIPHTTDAYHTYEKYCVHILIPGESKLVSNGSDEEYLAQRKNAELAVWIEDADNESWKGWLPWYINVNGIHPATIDGIQGWMLSQYVVPEWIREQKDHPNWDLPHTNYTADVHAEYRLENRRDGESGVVEITGTSDNATLPYTMNLIKTIHVTESKPVASAPLPTNTLSMSADVVRVGHDYQVTFKLTDLSGTMVSSDGKLLIAVASRDAWLKNETGIKTRLNGGIDDFVAFAKEYDIRSSNFKTEVQKVPNTNIETTTISCSEVIPFASLERTDYCRAIANSYPAKGETEVLVDFTSSDGQHVSSIVPYDEPFIECYP